MLPIASNLSKVAQPISTVVRGIGQSESQFKLFATGVCLWICSLPKGPSIVRFSSSRFRLVRFGSFWFSLVRYLLIWFQFGSFSAWFCFSVFSVNFCLSLDGFGQVHSGPFQFGSVWCCLTEVSMFRKLKVCSVPCPITH